MNGEPNIQTIYINYKDIKRTKLEDAELDLKIIQGIIELYKNERG